MEIAERISQQGDRVTLSLTSWGRLGEAMADFDGHNVFVAGGIPGERVVAEVVKVHRKYVSAKVVEVLEASADRVEPPCPYYGECTGCQWQHLAYSAQLKTKREKVADALQRVGDLVDPPVSDVNPSPDQYGYRNHARFTINREGALGFVNRETRQFVRIDKCLLMHEGVNSLLEELQDRCAETTQLSIRAGKYSGDFLVQPYMVHPDIGVTTGQKRYTESVDGKDFLVSSPSFFQVNVDQAVAAANVVRDRLQLGPEDVLLDAYTGVGTFAILLAPYVKRVIAVEESSAAVADARPHTPAAPATDSRYSGLEPLVIRPDSNFIMIGERTNVTGSRRFARLIKNRDYEAAVEVARLQVESGANIIDINMDEGLLDSAMEMQTFLNRIAGEPNITAVPIMIDSSNFDVIEAGLRCVQGKAIVNSISLKAGEDEFRRHAETCRRYGAAVVVMAFDEEGQAVTVQRRVEIFGRAYRILVDDLGFDPVSAGPLAEGVRMEPHTELFGAHVGAVEVREMLERFPDSARGRVVARARAANRPPS